MARIINYGSIGWKPKGGQSETPLQPEASSSSSVEKKREIMDKEKVWVSDPVEGFVSGRIVDLSDDGAVVEVIPPPSNHQRRPLTTAPSVVNTSYDRLYPAEEDEAKEVDDNCGLMYLNEATLLNNIRLRYHKDKIYTYVANILIAINPYSDIPDLYTAASIARYRGKSLGTLPPHVFAIADKAFRDMKVLKQSQSVIVSGESGAGKTESTKYILKYFCDNFGSGAGSIEGKILNANPILEAFGNAKTTRNNNSSRFGKFIEIHFDSRCQVAGGYISHYLLERARVVSQNPEERNYHIFYQLCAGAPEELRQKLRLGPPDTFRYLAHGCSKYFCHSKEADAAIPGDRKSADHKKNGCLRDPMLDDVSDFGTVDKDLKKLGMSDEERFSVYTTIAAVLHLGNVAFEDDPDDNRGGCRVPAGSSENALKVAASLMGLDADELRRALTARVMQTAKGGYKGTVIMVPLKTYEASNARDALAKATYSRLFDYIVGRINDSIPFRDSSQYYIGVLDIAGFEYFTVNSFEQFCINYCNEKLQQFFNQRILKDEQELYEREGLGVSKISFVDNQDCIDLIEAKPGNGIFALLDEESKLPKPSHQHFTSAVHSNFANHFRLALPRKSKLREHREIRDDDGFLIRHFAGAVCYQTQHFIEKNNDALHASLEALAQECKNTFIRGLFVNGQEANAMKGKLNFISVGSKFKSQLGDLMEKLHSTGTNFIRCIKPNVRMVARQFEGGSILSQLQCAGMTSVLELMQQGFPSRTPFSELYGMYRNHLPPDLVRLDPRLFCRALFRALGLNENDFKFGLTKVFFRPGKFAEFDQMMRSDPENLRILVAKVRKWILASRWKKAQWCALSVIKLKNKILYRRAALIDIQKNVRMYLAKKQHRPRYMGIMRLRKLQSQIAALADLGSKLKGTNGGNPLTAQQHQRIEAELSAAISKVQNSPKIGEAGIDSLYKGLVKQIDAQLKNVKDQLEKQRVAEEQARLQKIQEEMERERQLREEEERRKKALEEDRRLKAEMEANRKRGEAEEANLIQQLQADREAAMALQQSLNEENKRLREQIEQERRDHELALRLAAENNSAVVIEDSTANVQLKRSSAVQAQQQARAAKKYDLSKWKYAELRDTINTSCDIELLEACREEFHRRLKVYHAWKAKNKKKNPNNSSIMSGGADFPERSFRGDQGDFCGRPEEVSSLRAPSSILVEAAKVQSNNGVAGFPVDSQGAPNTAQRFFRIPFVRPSGSSAEGTTSAAGGSPLKQGQKGWWYAHFDGDWIGRQMELHPERPPVLLVAGKDDMQMCELALHETGLTRKRGAEILEHEFEKEWTRHGGGPYVKHGANGSSRIH